MSSPIYPSANQAQTPRPGERPVSASHPTGAFPPPPPAVPPHMPGVQFPAPPPRAVQLHASTSFASVSSVSTRTSPPTPAMTPPSSVGPSPPSKPMFPPPPPPQPIAHTRPVPPHNNGTRSFQPTSPPQQYAPRDFHHSSEQGISTPFAPGQQTPTPVVSRAQHPSTRFPTGGERFTDTTSQSFHSQPIQQNLLDRSYPQPHPPSVQTAQLRQHQFPPNGQFMYANQVEVNQPSPPAPPIHQTQFLPTVPVPAYTNQQFQPGSGLYPPTLFQQHQPHHFPNQVADTYPNHLPRPSFFHGQLGTPVQVYYPKAAMVSGESTQSIQPPPPADSRYRVIDDGNASPDLLRSTTYAFPISRALWHKSGDLPLGFTSMPLAAASQFYKSRSPVLPDGTVEDRLADIENTVPLITGLTKPPPRCGSCAAYVNPFFGLDGQCNFCGSRDVRVIQTLPSNIPMQFATVDYEVGGPFITRVSPVQPVFLYALDLTCPFVIEYLDILQRIGCDIFAEFQRQAQPSGDSSPTPRIGLCLVSANGIYLSAHRDALNRESECRYTVMSDITEDSFCPLPLEEWTFSLDTDAGLEGWTNLLCAQLQRDMAHLRQQALSKTTTGLDGSEQSCGGAAMAFLIDALRDCGGRGTILTWRRPNYGVGRLPHRGVDKSVLQGQSRPEDSKLYMPIQLQGSHKDPDEQKTAEFYKKIGAECAKSRVSLDVVMHTSPLAVNQHLDLATLGEVCRETCGKLTWINCHTWHKALYEELSRQVQMFTGWDAIFKARCSSGIQVKTLLAPSGTVIEGSLGGSPELELSSVTPSSCIAVEVEHKVGGLPKDSKFVYFQTALLFSSLSGKRFVRISTLALRTTNAVEDIFRFADYSATAALFTAGTVDYLRKHKTESDVIDPRQKARDALYYRVLNIMLNYRQNTSAITSPLSQLMLPQRLQLLPLWCMCLLKSASLIPAIPRRIPGIMEAAISPTADERAYSNYNLSRSNPAVSTILVYPNVFPIRLDTDAVGQWQRPDGELIGFVEMPESAPPTVQSLADDAVYLIDDGLRIFLYVGSHVSMETRHAALSLNDVDNNDNAHPIHEVIRNMVWQIRTWNGVERGSESPIRLTYAPLVMVLQQEGHQGPGEAQILNLMIEDANAGEKDYRMFLDTMQKKIREQLQAKK